ncbi:hypothetical protein [Persicitalea sp.]|uniref:hypothetical protein n=1 Tax=Persicitalea sp. TaxID=3100273 RepID=UPI0035930C09
MKKPNNIDDLFARKLSNLERTPSPDLWQRIEQGQKKESRRLGGWYWYAAASVTILLMAGYLVWQGETKTVEPQGQMAQTEQMTKPREGTLPTAPQSGDTEALASTQQTESVQKNSRPVISQKESYATVVKEKAPEVPKLERAPILEGTQIARVEKAETDPSQLVTKNDAMKSLQPTEIQTVVPGKVSPDTQDRIIVAHVETEDLANEAQKSSKFLRVLRQLKNAKQGDEVEWDELGFNPKRILARADERLRNGEDKISDKYQELKNKTKL